MILNDIDEATRYAYELKNENSTIVYTSGLVVPDPSEDDPVTPTPAPDPTPTPEPVPSTAAKLEINFYTPSNNWLGVEYILGDKVWTNEMAVVSGVNYWRNAFATALSGSDGASTLIYKTPSNAAQTRLAGGKGLNPNANLKTSDQYWQVAVPLNLPSGVSYTFKSVLPEILTLTYNNGLQIAGNQLQLSAEVSVVKDAVTNATGRIGPSSYLTGTLINTVVGAMPKAVTLEGENTLFLRMWHDDGDSTKSQVYTAALGVELYLYEGPSIAGTDQGTIAETNGMWVVTPADNVTEIAIDNAGTHTIVFPPSVTEVTGVSTDKIVIAHGGNDYGALFTKSGDASAGVKIMLTNDKTAGVTIGGETITLEPVLTAITEGESEGHAITAPFVVGDGSAAVGIKSIPGLKYTLVRGGDVIDVALPSEKSIDVISTRATGTRLKLQDVGKPDGKAFYVIRVGQ